MKNTILSFLLILPGLVTAGQVTGVVAEPSNPSNVMVSWAMADDADYYDLYQDSVRIESGLLGTSHLVNGLLANTAYQFFLTACNTDGVCSEASIQVRVVTPMAAALIDNQCDMPAGINIPVVKYTLHGDGTAHLMWCQVAGAEGYNLYLDNQYVATHGPDVFELSVDWAEGDEYQIAWFGNGEYPAKSAVAMRVQDITKPVASLLEQAQLLDKQTTGQANTIEIYFTRHAEKRTEIENQENGSQIEICGVSKCAEELNAKGQLRAELLAQMFKSAGITDRLTHVFSSHKKRTRQTIAQIALESGLSGDVDKYANDGIQEYPVSNNDGTANATELDPESTSPSVQPTIDALLNLPAGSVALVAGHSGSIYNLMAGIGLTDVCLSDTVSTTCNQNRYPIDAKAKVKNFGDIWKIILTEGEAVFVYRVNLQPRELQFVELAK